MLQVPSQYWEELTGCDPAVVAVNSGALVTPQKGFIFPFLNQRIQVDCASRRLLGEGPSQWHRLFDPLLELVCLTYLLKASPNAVSGIMAGVKELRSAHFFTGPHEFDLGPLAARFGRDTAGFRRAAERVKGEPLDLADAAYRLQALPKIPLHYLLWKGDEEFDSRLTILFDRGIEDHLPADAIWALVNLVSKRLLSEA